MDVELPPDATSEQRALGLVSGRSPDRVNLRKLLDQIFVEEREGGLARVDVQPVRRLWHGGSKETPVTVRPAHGCRASPSKSASSTTAPVSSRAMANRGPRA